MNNKKKKILLFGIICIVIILIIICAIIFTIMKNKNISYYEEKDRDINNLEYSLECDGIEDELYVSYGIDDNIKRNTKEYISDYTLSDGIYVHDIDIYSEDGKSTIIEMLVEDTLPNEEETTGFNLMIIKEVNELHAMLKISDLKFKEKEVKKVIIKVPNDIVGLKTIVIKRLGENDLYEEVE